MSQCRARSLSAVRYWGRALLQFDDIGGLKGENVRADTKYDTPRIDVVLHRVLKQKRSRRTLC